MLLNNHEDGIKQENPEGPLMCSNGIGNGHHGYNMATVEPYGNHSNHYHPHSDPSKWCISLTGDYTQGTAWHMKKKNKRNCKKIAVWPTHM